MERSYWVFVEGSRVVLVYRLAYKNLIAAVDPYRKLVLEQLQGLHSSVPDLLPSHQQFTEYYKCTMSGVTEEKEENKKKY